jgi:hypothetical protein
LKEKAVDFTWRTGFERGCGPALSTGYGMNVLKNVSNEVVDRSETYFISCIKFYLNEPFLVTTYFILNFT